jgi:hypothetical protein
VYLFSFWGFYSTGRGGYEVTNFEIIPNSKYLIHAVKDADFAYYSVYRYNQEQEFDPRSNSAFMTTVDTIIVDTAVNSDSIYCYRVSATDFSGNESEFSAEASLVVYVENNSKDLPPKNYFVSQNYPNPFNPNTVIDYQLPHESQVTLKIYNSMGQVVRVLDASLPIESFTHYSQSWTLLNSQITSLIQTRY